MNKLEQINNSIHKNINVNFNKNFPKNNVNNNNVNNNNVNNNIDEINNLEEKNKGILNKIETFRLYLKNLKIWGYKFEELIVHLALFIVIPSFSFQIYKLIRTGSAKDYSLYFILLQMLGTPEGGGAFITGIMTHNINLAITGGYGLFYYCIALFYYLYPRI